MKETTRNTICRNRQRLQYFEKCAVISILILAGCTKVEPMVVVITATPTHVTAELLSQTNVPNTATSVESPISPTAASAQSVVPTPTYETYVVQSGDTLSGIAAQFGVRLETLLKVNNITDPKILEVGQVIVLPGKPSTESP